MKVGDLCTFHWGEGVHVYLGEGGYVGWYKVLSLKTGVVSQTQRQDIRAVKKCP
jgi:hypothetical protein